MQFLTLFCCLSLLALAVGEKVSVCKTLEIDNANRVTKTCTGQTVFLPGSAGAPGSQGPPGADGGCECSEAELASLQSTVDFLQNVVSGTDIGAKYYWEKCSAGVADLKKVPNSAMTASSTWPGLLPYYGRVNSRQSWSVRKNNANQWLQVDFKKPITVAGVVVQARGDYPQWVKTYKIQYGDKVGDLKTVKEKKEKKEDKEKDMVFTYDGTASNYRTLFTMGRFPKPVRAQIFRLIPITYYGWMSLRLDYVTC